jgi:hypothetical protein
MERLRNDFDVLVELTGRAMAAYIAIDPGQEWTMEEIAEMAVDQALAVQLEMKRRKNEHQKASNINQFINTRQPSPMPGGSPREHH